jgi:crotonobetainyl-CoA:carnitine CoA-transferase CaiB-like acyl-CoA transferase
LLVVAVEQAVAAPYCSSRLADAGARVIKVERPEGDFARNYDHVARGESAYFVWLNRGKESIVLDIKDEEDHRFLLGLIEEADVFIQNLAPGAAARMGMGSKQLRHTNPRLITVDISGYGEEGPFRDMKAYDLLVQSESGLASITGAPSEPGRVGVSICDISCGMYAHAAVLEALIGRGITGEGREIHVSLFDSIADWMTVPLLHHDYGGAAPERVGLNHPTIAPYGVYQCMGDESVVLSIQNEREWQRFCRVVLENPDLAVDTRFDANPQRCINRIALDAEINQVFSINSRAEILQRLQTARIAFGALNSVADFSGHPQLRRVSLGTGSGSVEVVAPPVIFSDLEYRPGAVPSLGEHSERIRLEFSSSSVD